jgi:predicted transcriptional regulator
MQELMAEQPFDRISMAEVATRCSLARSTIYRKYSDTAEILWSLAMPTLTAALRAALSADRDSFIASANLIWSTAGLAPALSSAGASSLRHKLAQLASSEVERATRRQDASACGLVVAGAWFALIEAHASERQVPSDHLVELMSLTYVSAFLTPAGLGAAARRQAAQVVGSFPAAVSARESLANDDYIISMIDGRRYRSLTRHIGRFGMSPEQYRKCFGLPPNYPMVAPAYSAIRRELANTMRLGRRTGHEAHSVAVTL